MRSHAQGQTRSMEAYTSFSVTALSTRATFLMWARFRHSDGINLEWRQVDRFEETVRSSLEISKLSAKPKVSQFFKLCPRSRRAAEPCAPPRILRRPAPRPNYRAGWILRSKNIFNSGVCLTAGLSLGQTGT